MKTLLVEQWTWCFYLHAFSSFSFWPWGVVTSQFYRWANREWNNFLQHESFINLRFILNLFITSVSTKMEVGGGVIISSINPAGASPWLYCWITNHYLHDMTGFVNHWKMDWTVRSEKKHSKFFGEFRRSTETTFICSDTAMWSKSAKCPTKYIIPECSRMKLTSTQ